MDAREYTTPLSGTPYFRSVGIIKATDKMNYQYNIECCGISRSTFYRRMREYRNKGWKSPGNSI